MSRRRRRKRTKAAPNAKFVAFRDHATPIIERPNEVDTDYSDSSEYSVMLTGLYATYKARKSESTACIRFKTPELECTYGRGAQTKWTNFKLTCSFMQRDIDHVMKFVISELSTECNMSPDGLVIAGRYTVSNLMGIITRYATMYIQCTSCKKSNSTMTRNSVLRMYDITCLECGSTRKIRK